MEEALEPPAPGEVVLRVRAAAICGSDLKVLGGAKRARPGVCLGHEVAGEVWRSAHPGMPAGRRVAVYPSYGCGACHLCRRGRDNLCVHKRTIGYALDGGFADHLRLPPEMVEGLLELPPEVSFEEGALLEPLGCVVGSVDKLSPTPGDRVLVLGAGPMGLMHLLVLRARGAEVALCDPLVARRAAALRLGAALALAPEELEEGVRRWTEGRGPDACVVAVGAPGLVETALRLVRPAGAVCLFAGFPPGSRLELDPNRVHYGELRLVGTHSLSRAEFRKALELVRRRQVDLRPLITHRFPLQRAEEALAVYRERRGLKVLLLPADA